MAVAAVLGTIGLDARIDQGAYDEGVYWQTLRAIDRGYALYSQVFDSQPPLFPLALYPIYHLLGGTLAAARLALAIFWLVGLAGAYASGRLLAGRTGGLIALLLGASAPISLIVSRHIEAEGPGTAMLFLALSCALGWWRDRGGRAGLVAIGTAGACVTVGVLLKLLDVSGYALLVLMLGSAFAVAARRREPLWPVIRSAAVAGIVSCVTALVILMPFEPAWPALYHQVVQFHFDARIAFPLDLRANADLLEQQFLVPNAKLGTLALVGLLVGIWLRDVRAFFMGAWLLVSVILLLQQTPLFDRHALILLPPLIGLALLAAVPCRAVAGKLAWGRLALAMVAAISALGWIEQERYLSVESQISDNTTQTIAGIVADIDDHVQRGRWIITDLQIAAGIADRDTPPGLVDTSKVRITSGFLDADTLCAAAADSRVAAVLPASGRLSLPVVDGFQACLKEHFVLFRTYGSSGAALWLRQEKVAPASDATPKR